MLLTPLATPTGAPHRAPHPGGPPGDPGHDGNDPPPGPDPTWLWQQAERYLGGGTRSYSRYAGDLEITEAYHPQRGADRFTVPTVRVPHRAGHWLTSRVASRLHALYRDRDGFLLPVHPETATVPSVADQLAGLAPGPAVQAVPSANARTVFVTAIDGTPVPPHFLKLHYPRRLSRFTRRLRRPVIALQLWVADELHRTGAPVLPEVGGGVLGHDPSDSWGFLLREATVRTPPAAPAAPYTVPLFALYGDDVRAPDDPTLLEQLVAASGEDPVTWVTRRLITPVVALWADTLRRTGCALEPHGQNTLLRFSADGRTTALAYRDCAVYVDPAMRRARGLTRALPPRNVLGHDIRIPRARVLSLVYDSFLGHHTLAYVARLLRDRYGVDEQALAAHARTVAAETLPERDDLLPATVYYYDDQLHPDGGWQLVDTGRTPQWR